MDEEEYKKLKEDFSKKWIKLTNKYRNRSIDELKDKFKKEEMKKYDRLNFAFVNIHMLLDFMKVIDKNASELESPGSKIVSESSMNIRPSQSLYQYIILEIVSFYDLIKELKKKENILFPDLPNYFWKLKDFRNQIVAHLDKDGRLKTKKEWMEKYEAVDKIGMGKIIDDFYKYYFRCWALLKEDI